MINEIANEEKKVNFVTKISVIKTINKKSSQKRANFRLKNLAKNMELFKHKKLNSNVITKSDQNKTNKNEINKSLSKENKKNSKKKMKQKENKIKNTLYAYKITIRKKPK